jgi:3-hydroxyisobutyrate dehydrogenase-like beta-hydroxyacid dehydrogenase
MKKPSIGFIGLGNMGSPMAQNISKAGYDLTVFNRSKQVYSKFEGSGVTYAAAPKEVGQKSEVIFTCLPSVEASESVWLGPEGVLCGAKSGSIFVELSTVDPELVKRLGARASEKNIMVLDAGVSGGVKKAADGTLTIMAGGSKDVFDKICPIFRAIGQKSYHVGGLGAGMVVKLINNAIAHINVVAFLECISVGLKAGVDIDTLYEVISQGSGTSRQFETRFKNKVMKRDFEPGMKLALVYKDSMLMQEMAAQLNMPIFLTSVSHQIFEMGCAKGFKDKDYAVLIKIWDELSLGGDTYATANGKHQRKDI